MCTDPDGNSLNYNKKAEVHNHDEQRRIHSITTRQKIQSCTKHTYRNIDNPTDVLSFENGEEIKKEAPES